jgi:hypothetical protein
MPRKNYGTPLKLLPFLLISACATKPPDVPVCIEFAPDRGACVRIISGQEFKIDENNKFEAKTWWEHRPAMILVPASSWAELKSFIIKACKKYNNCDQEIESWERTLNTIDGLHNKP